MSKEWILQIGEMNWASHYDIPDNLGWCFCPIDQIETYFFSSQKQAVSSSFEQEAVQDYRLIVITSDGRASWDKLFPLVEAYEVFYPQNLVVLNPDLQDFLDRKRAQIFLESPQDFLKTLAKISFKKPYGAKIPIRDFVLSPQFINQSFAYLGNQYLSLMGEFGQDYTFVGNYTYNLLYHQRQPLDFWQEFILDPGVDIMIKFQLFDRTEMANLLKTWEIKGSQLNEQYRLDTYQDGYLAISIWLKGGGQVRLGPLHYRFSRLGYGEFIFGGQRYVDDRGQEFHYYFNPGDAKPPLMVYFSGWRTAEGFEGFPMMKKLKAPFLLFCDPRLEGGSFYLGSRAFEAAIKQVIKESLLKLGFDQHRDLVLSGLSMGTFGALYYASFLSPHALVLGKPLTNLGTIAQRERLERPGGFATSLDILQSLAGGLDYEAVNQLNEHFWKVFKQADLSGTKIYLTYMTNDDYDHSASQELRLATKLNGAQLVMRPFPGRHNDAVKEVGEWFQHQAKQLLAEDFSR